jgi:GT2 family glycosyltransferase
MLSIIYVSYNSDKEIKSSIKSIEENYSGPKEIIIVDNSKDNVGFAAGANKGALSAHGEFLLFVNPDTVIKPNSVSKMITFMQENKDAGVVSCKVLNPDGSLQPSCGCFPTVLNCMLDRTHILNRLIKTELIRKNNYYGKEQTPDWISGVFFLTTKEVFEKLKGFNEDYFMYVEDIDYCYRARSLGYKTYYLPEPGVVHYNTNKSKEAIARKSKYMRVGLSTYFNSYKSSCYNRIWRVVSKFERMLKPNLQ